MATAEQIVGAVLDATNKRYVVECGKSETAWYERYSDGFIRQGGIYTAPEHDRRILATIQFPIPFTQKAGVVITGFDLDDEPVLYLEISTTSVRTRLENFDAKVYGWVDTDTPYGFNWVAEGY